ncbi:universal stress protein [Pseudonocardia zijingensis]|jgi:nucleotide-binding universal stress UspA family protein|uniref:UspA domain-containing protein n=1 Tax=Pseudonocardia zijingensis TaxID=153376 RepID=A0ABN1QLP1_9PSEU
MSETLERPTNATAEPSRTPTATLVVGHRHGSSDDRALTVAADLGRRLDARLHVVHVVVLADYPVDPDAADWDERGEQTLAEERHHVEAALVRTGLRWSYESCKGAPATALAHAAVERDALLIVVGTRGAGLRATLSRFARPSVSHALVERQDRPVLVVPPLRGDRRARPGSTHGNPRPQRRTPGPP